MKYILVLVSLFVVSGCASGPVLEKAPCDPVMNREDLQVCGKDSVRKSCKQAVGRSEFICDKL